MFVKLVAEGRAHAQQAEVVDDDPRTSCSTLGGVDGVDQHRVRPRREADPAPAAAARTRASWRGSPSRWRRELRAGAGRGGRRPVDQGPEARARRAARSRAGRLARRHRRPGRAGAAAGVRRHRRRRLGRSVGRDARRHGAPRARGARRSSPISSRCRSSCSGPNGPVHDVPLGQVARVTPSIGPARIDHLDRERVITVEANTEDRPLSEVVDDIMARVERTVHVPAGLRAHAGRRDRGPGGGLHADVRRARRRGDADVLRPGRAVRVVPRSARDPAVAAAVAHRRRAGAARSPATRSTS